VIALLTTTDAIKLGAVRALLSSQGIATEEFDSAAGALWRSIIPLRLMVAEADADGARALLREAGFVAAGDGDWDLAPSRRSPPPKRGVF
jgi:hypothetical protein